MELIGKEFLVHISFSLNRIKDLFTIHFSTILCSGGVLGAATHMQQKKRLKNTCNKWMSKLKFATKRKLGGSELANKKWLFVT